jgi:hypothetical protein
LVTTGAESAAGNGNAANDSTGITLVFCLKYNFSAGIAPNHGFSLRLFAADASTN